LLVPTAGIESDGAREGLAICLDELDKMGIRNENILVYNLELILSKSYQRTYSAYVAKPAMISRLLTVEEAKSFDAIFVTGGDASVLCREMRRTGFDEVLTAAVNEGLVYVGISAGSMFAAGNLSEGLRFIPNGIIPHWNGDKMLAMPENNGDILLSDGQAVYIEDDQVSLL
ncbi:MAG: Type 1 glutamine amidotransferase-like domain-containing protein, partial [Lachnospiraceae bacterium]|nr:Type 1 glutamine amidotransferase-like domain-containing protein [Lachnospiraceae bacterium]